MGKLYSLILALLIAVGSLYAVEPSGYEWWLDNDVSSVTSGIFPAGKLDIQIDTSDLPRGAHYFNCRLNTAEGQWGAVYRRMFYSIGKDDGAIGYEYWFDNEYDAKETGTLTDGKKTFAVNVSSLTPGVHYFNCRLNASENEWGAVYRKMIYAAEASQDVSAYEYWFDNDYDSKEGGEILKGISTFSVDAAALTPGVHYFNCRLCTTDGKWGSAYRKMVFTTPTGIDAAAYEYWIDDKYDSKTEGDIAEGSNVFTVDLSGLRRGLHRFNYRIRTGAGTWGAVYSKYFYMDPNASFPKTYEYWLDDDYEGRQSMTSESNTVSFNIDLSVFDKSAAKPHFFNLRVFEEGFPESSAFYRKLIIPFKGVKAPIIGYRHYINGDSLGYVEVERQFVDSYMFDINLPDSLYPSVKNRRPIFDADKVSVADADSVDYIMQIRTELGWSVPQEWRMELKNDFSTTAVEMKVNTKQTFVSPSGLEFAAVKFTSSGNPLYFRSDIPVALDIYKDGNRVEAISPAQLKDMTMLQLEEGEYYGILYGVEDSEAKNFTLHLMDTPNIVPMPEISFEDGMVTMTCSRSDAEIRYTLDESEPTEESQLYTEAFALSRNATVKAKAFVTGSDIEPSIVAELIVDSYKTATPTGVFDVEARQLILTCATEGASLSYTFDREGEWTAYTAPITITRNCTVYAKASFPGYNDSDIAEIAITELANSVADPEISFANGLVTITCENGDAEIHYTVDGSEPTAESPKYTEPFSLAVNGIVKAFAFIPGLDIPTSNVSQLIVDSYKTATPTGVFDMPSRTMTLSCSTAGAAISYRIGVAGEWTDYTGPFNIGRNITVYAKASLEGYNDSDVAEIAVTGFPDSMPQPVITFSDGKVTITCERSDALIRYTLDKTSPTMESTLYEGPFALSHNATIWAIAYIPNSDIEPSEISELVVDSYQTATPTGNFDYESGKLSLKCATEGATISYALNAPENWIVYESPIEISGNCTVYAKASAEGYNESEMLVMEIGQFRCSPVDVSYNGRFVTMKTEDPQAEIRYSVILPDGVVTVEDALYIGKIDVQTLCHISAKAVREGYQDSEVSEYSVNCYGDENHAETNAGGLLASGFEWCGSELLNGISEFKVEGILNDDDYSFLKSMQGLRHLDINRVSDARIPANAFKGSRLISISLPADITEYGDSILSESQDLCSVIWNSDSKDVDGALIKGIANLNALIYLPVGVSVEDSSGLNIVEGNSASSIILHDGFPFYVAREFTAANISYTRNFEMNTFFDISAGWETIVLPFAPESITHETAGEIVPFAAWNGDTSGGPKPFWLYRSDSDGWKEADCIEAGVPYIISMPNNADYVASFNLNGKVTFSGARVQLTPETNLLDATPWVNGTMFEGTFLRVEEDGLLSLNVHCKEQGIYPGSAFVDDDVTAPFGAYVRHAGSRKFMPLFGNYNAVQYPSLGAGLTIVTPAPGLLCVSSNRECKVDVVTATGVRIHTFHLMPGETQTLEGLTRDMYIVAGRKVMVK